MKTLSRCVLWSAASLLAAGVAYAAQSAAARSAGAEPGPSQSKDQNYPTRPVRMIVPFAPGGASDFVGRILQPKLDDALGQTVVVDNRTGAAGNIGVEIAARATPDGYNLLLGNIGTMAVNPSIFPNFPIKPLRDLIGVTLVADIPGALAVNASVPVATVKEFIDYAKARPGQLNYSSSGGASTQRLAFEVFMRKTGIKIAHIPYKGGAGPSTLALLGGEVEASTATVASYIPLLKSGKIRVLAVIAPQRIPQLPDMPTMAELGYPEWVLGSWLGVHVPAGTRRPIVNKLYSVIIKIMSDPWVIERLGAGGAQVITSKSPEDYAAFMRAQNEYWARVVKEIGVTAE